jgi:hypothetical protein
MKKKRRHPKPDRVTNHVPFDHILRRVSDKAKQLGFYLLSTMGRQATWTVYDQSTGAVVAHYYPETFILVSSCKHHRMKVGSALDALFAIRDWRQK